MRNQEVQEVDAIFKSSEFVKDNARSVQKLIEPAEEAIVGLIKPFPQLAEWVFLHEPKGPTSVFKD